MKNYHVVGSMVEDGKVRSVGTTLAGTSLFDALKSFRRMTTSETFDEFTELTIKETL